MRAMRRHHDRRVKARAAVKLRMTWGKDASEITPAMVGKNATQHGTCDCWMCKHRHTGREEKISDRRNATAYAEEV